MLIHVSPIKLCEDLTCSQICANIILIDDTLGFENVAFAAKEAVDAGLEGFLNNEALDDHVELAPELNQVGNQRIFTEVHSCSRALLLFSHVFEDVLGWYDTFPLCFVRALGFGWVVWRISHVLVNKLAHVENV